MTITVALQVDSRPASPESAETEAAHNEGSFIAFYCN